MKCVEQWGSELVSWLVKVKQNIWPQKKKSSRNGPEVDTLKDPKTQAAARRTRARAKVAEEETLISFQRINTLELRLKTHESSSVHLFTHNPGERKRKKGLFFSEHEKHTQKSSYYSTFPFDKLTWRLPRSFNTLFFCSFHRCLFAMRECDVMNYLLQIDQRERASKQGSQSYRRWWWWKWSR